MWKADAHVDTLMKLASGIDPNDAALHVTPEKLKKGGVRLQVMALFVGTDAPETHPYEKSMALARCLPAFLNAANGQARQIKDLPIGPLAEWDDAISVLLSIENCASLENSLERLNEFYEMGVRIASLTWNGENGLAHGCFSGNAGLKPFGRQAIRRMNRLGIAVDLSHVNSAGFWDALEASDKPPMCTHSCCASLCDVPRNLNDAQIRALIQCGGHIGVNYYPKFLTPSGEACASDIADHIDHIAQLGGAHIVGLGSDYDGIGTTPSDMPDASFHGVLCDELSRRGYNGETLAGIMGENLVRYLQNTQA